MEGLTGGIPVILRNTRNVGVTVISIADSLEPEWKDVSNEEGVQLNSEIRNLQIWSLHGWQDILGLKKYKVKDEKFYRIVTNNSVLEISGGSKVFGGGGLIPVSDIKVGDELNCSFPGLLANYECTVQKDKVIKWANLGSVPNVVLNEPVEGIRLFLDNFSNGESKYRVVGMVKAMKLYYLAKSLFKRNVIEVIKNDRNHYHVTVEEEIKNVVSGVVKSRRGAVTSGRRGLVKKKRETGKEKKVSKVTLFEEFEYSGYVYTFVTKNGYYSAGIGELSVVN